MNVCASCGCQTGTGVDLCLPCRVALKSVSGASDAFPKRCGGCGEPLTNRISRERGYGPSCWARRQALDKGYEPEAEFRP